MKSVFSTKLCSWKNQASNCTKFCSDSLDTTTLPSTEVFSIQTTVPVVPCRIDDDANGAFLYQSCRFHNQSDGHTVQRRLISPIKKKWVPSTKQVKRNIFLRTAIDSISEPGISFREAWNQVKPVPGGDTPPSGRNRPGDPDGFVCTLPWL